MPPHIGERQGSPGNRLLVSYRFSSHRKPQFFSPVPEISCINSINLSVKIDTRPPIRINLHAR